jgi:shikimate dehydrogenase
VVAERVDWHAVPPDCVAYDVVYAPPSTPFVERARASGLSTASGLGMLVRQGAFAFELWLAVAPPLDVMRAAIS